MALQKLGPFELLRVLGRGGMGTVYEARETGSDERVAVKALAPSYSFDEQFRSRFEGEIDALMSLDHENIVRLLSYGQDEGNLFFAMELVDGTSLFQEQKQGQVFHWREVIDIGIQVCEGLRHAHDRGIIHRDLKPGNLMIGQGQQVKITDFGIAKSFGKSSQTAEGNVLGTMDFMAPEQARGQNTNARSDLFSLGAVLYSLLVGRPPFLRESVEMTFEALLSPDPPPRLDKVAGDIPKPLARLIHRLMEKDPSRRIATAQATSRQLANVRDVIMNSPKMDTQVVKSDIEEFENALGAANTREVADHNTGHLESEETSARLNSGNQATRSSARSPSQKKTSGGGHDDPSTRDMQKNSPDYFQEVTAQQRKRKSEPLTSTQIPTSIWPLFLALIFVVLITSIGIWFTLFRPPDKKELLRVLQDAERNPIGVQDEIRQFKKWFSDEPEIEYVDQLFRRIEVVKYCNNLRARKKISVNNPLSQIESKFLSIYDQSSENMPNALEQIQSFLRVYANSDSLNPLESRAIEMAQRTELHWIPVAKKQIDEGRQFIVVALERARNSGNRDDAMDLFKSVIDIYGDDHWAQERVEEARNELKKMEEQPPQ